MECYINRIIFKCTFESFITAIVKEGEYLNHHHQGPHQKFAPEMAFFRPELSGDVEPNATVTTVGHKTGQLVNRLRPDSVTGCCHHQLNSC